MISTQNQKKKLTMHRNNLSVNTLSFYYTNVLLNGSFPFRYLWLLCVWMVLVLTVGGGHERWL